MARREYNENVRNLARFVKKRDKRVMAYEQREKAEELARAASAKQAASQAAEAARSQRQKFAAEEHKRLDEQARVRKERYGEIDEAEEAERSAKAKAKPAVELECFVCGKSFKSEAQYANHEKSKKHIDAVKREQALQEDMLNDSDDEDESASGSEDDADADSEDERLRSAEWACQVCRQTFETEEQCFIHIELVDKGLSRWARLGTLPLPRRCLGRCRCFSIGIFARWLCMAGARIKTA